MPIAVEMKKILCSVIALWVLSLAIETLGLRLALFEPSLGWANSSSQESKLLELNLEELMNIEVTLLTKKKQKLSESAAAVYVIMQEDIRRSGVTSIPEALRLAPGLQVARIDSNKWAISSRGFNDRFANKLLVLIDGRSVYTPLFSGVYWDVQDVLLEDVERIEVIRGPGGTLWGANAVNGIINIITKSAKDTQGGLVSTGGGSEEQGFSGFRYGGKMGEAFYSRLYGKYFNRDTFFHGHDDWRMGRLGFRTDWELDGSNTLTFQGDYYDGENGERLGVPILISPFSTIFNDDPLVSGGNFLFRWKHEFYEDSDLVLQLYYDKTQREVASFEEVRDTFDLDFQHRFNLSERQGLVWGLGYRITTDDIHDLQLILPPRRGFVFSPVSFIPDTRDDHLFSAFLQDEINLVKDKLSLTLGSKFEHNDYTGFEYQPRGSLTWTPASRHTLWAAVSRAVRTPTRAEEDAQIVVEAFPPGTTALLPGLVTLISNRDFDSEELLAYELGYRLQVLDTLILDLATFYNVYDHLRTFELGTSAFKPLLLPHRVIPFSADNKMDGETYGVELTTRWQALNWWRLEGSYTFLQIQMHPDGDSNDSFSLLNIERTNPHNQFSIRSLMDLPRNLEFDWGVRFVDNLPGHGVESYLAIDLRLGWKPNKNLEMSLVGQNLLDSHHLEWVDWFYQPRGIEVEPGVYAKITWRF